MVAIAVQLDPRLLLERSQKQKHTGKSITVRKTGTATAKNRHSQLAQLTTHNTHYNI